MILSLSSIFLFLFVALLVCFAFILSQSSFMLCFVWHVFVCLFSVFVYFVWINKIKKKLKNQKKKYKNSVCVVYIGTCVPWMAIETKSSKVCIVCSLDEHLYAHLNKWALWLLFVMSKIKLSLILNTRITLFDGND